MNLYSPGDEDGLQSTHPFPDFCWDMCQPIGDIMQPGHAQQSLELHSNSDEATSSDNPDYTISLLCRTPEESSDPGISSSNIEWVTDFGMCSEEDRSLQTRPEPEGTYRKKCPQALVFKCTVCGKVFTSASSLSKHVLVHSQKRSHICKVCKKAFKRNDHLMGHMLTHLKTKPFMCTEQGCSKSYCDSRSLRRHYVVQHGLCTLQEVNAKTGTQCEEPLKKELPKTIPHFIQNETAETVSSQSHIPIKDAFSCLVTGVVSDASLIQISNQPVSQSMALNGSNILKECSSLLMNCTSSSAYTLINTSSKDSMCPGTVIFSDSSSQLLNLCSDKFLKNQPVLQSHKINFKQNQLDNSMAGSLGTLDYCAISGNPIETCAGTLNALSQMYMSPGVKAPGVPSLCPNSGNDLSHRVMRTEETLFPNDPDFSKHIIQPCESSTMQIESPQIFLQPMPNSQSALSQSTKQAVPNLSVHQCAAETVIMSIPPEKHMGCTNNVQGSSLMIDNTSSYSQAEEVRSFSGDFCVTESVAGTKQDLRELLTADIATDCNPLTSSDSKPWTWNLGNPQHKWSFNKEQLNLILSSTIPPSQVALDSFSASHTSPSDQNESRVFNKFQGENIYTLPSRVGGSSATTGRLHTVSGMKETTDPTALLLSVSVGEEHTILCDDENKHSRPLQDVHNDDIGSGIQEAGLLTQSFTPSTWITKDTTAGHLVIPVSVPVSMKYQQEEDKVNGTASELQSITTKTGKQKKKKRPSPKSLYIPPPLLETNHSPSGCFQSNLHSPTIYLSEYLQNGIFQCPPYTPPPMLSPIRQGSGLYFNTFCTATCTKGPVPSLPEKDISSSGISLVKDDMVLTIHPHINIGDRFQAEIPERQDALFLKGEDEKADLVWRPLLETKAVSCLLNVACSSAVPGGGNNLEFALHCLHISQGNIMEALDKLLLKEPQEYLPRWLADYHYAGSDHWSLAERRQYKKAYSKHRKDFSYIQSLLPGKSVYQCVEYYYTWKKIINFDRRRTSATSQGSSNEQSYDLDKCGGSMEDYRVKNTIQDREPEPESKEASNCSQQDFTDRAEPLQEFACTECDRVFDRVKSRNAHMKRHRQQERALHLAHDGQWISKQLPTPCDISLCDSTRCTACVQVAH